jgi:hypothetical protein
MIREAVMTRDELRDKLLYAGRKYDGKSTIGSLIEQMKVIEQVVTPLRNALQGIVEIGKRDMSNPKYDGYFLSAVAALNDSVELTSNYE